MYHVSNFYQKRRISIQFNFNRYSLALFEYFVNLSSGKQNLFLTLLNIVSYPYQPILVQINCSVDPISDNTIMSFQLPLLG